MEPTEALQLVRDEMRRLQDQGQKEIDLQALDRWLVGIQMNASASLTVLGVNAQREIAHGQLTQAHQQMVFESIIDAGKTALKAVITVNSGAAVAVLSFLGGAPTHAAAPYMGLPLADYGLGVLLGVAAFGAKYFAQAFDGLKHVPGHTEKQLRRFASGFAWGNGLSIALGIASLVCFGLGLGNLYIAFS